MAPNKGKAKGKGKGKLLGTIPKVPQDATRRSSSRDVAIPVSNSNIVEEQVDPNFRVHSSNEFQRGKVFKIIWAEPKSLTQEPESNHSTTSGSIGDESYRRLFMKVLRFVVIETRQRYCECLPIVTYNGMGVTKRGVRADHHTVIYSGSWPVYLTGEKEKGIIDKPIKVDMLDPRHKLDKSSRLNYAKPHIVEYNVKVWFIGSVALDSIPLLFTDYYRDHSMIQTDNMFPAPTTMNVLAPPASGLATSYSSVLHPMTITDISQRLTAMLQQDTDLRFLFKDISSRATLDHLEKRLERGLKHMSAHLEIEIKSSKGGQIARSIRNMSRNVAHLFRNTLEAQFDIINAEDPRASYNTPSDLDKDDEGDVDLDPVDELNNSHNIFHELEIIVLQSKSFAILKESILLSVRPNQAKSALSKCWEFTISRETCQNIRYEVRWDIPKFLKTYFPEGQLLGDIITVTGTAIMAEALRCRDYMCRQWGDLGREILEELEASLSGKQNPLRPTSKTSFELKDLQLEEDVNLTEHGRKFQSLAKMQVFGNYDTHIQFISALSWLCAAVRYSPYTQVGLSSITINAIQKGKMPENMIGIYVSELEPLPVGQTCWHSIFPHCVIAKDFPISERVDGKGLEVSFQDMVLMSRSLSFVEFDGGLIIEGLNSLLIPIQELEEDQALQWHFEIRKTELSRRNRSVRSILQALGDSSWYKELDRGALAARRCFLGWVEDSLIMMGSKKHANAPIRWSQAQASPRTRYVHSPNFTIGTSGAGFFTAEVQLTRTSVSVPSHLTMPVNKDIYDTLSDDGGMHVFVHDTGNKTTWCLPQACVVLHILHALVKSRKYQLFKGGDLRSLPYVELGSVNGEEALSILREVLAFTVVKQGLERNKSLETLAVTVKQVWQFINTIRTGLDGAMIEFSKLGLGPPKLLHGVEFLSVMKLADRLEIREVPINAAWTHLTSEDTAVIFCSGMRQPIVPKSLDNLCDKWREVPAGQQYLVATAFALQYFLEQNDTDEEGSRLHEKFQWLYSETLIESHERGSSKKSVVHTQNLRTTGFRRSPFDLDIQRKLQSYTNSVFVFSKEKSSKACLQVIKAVRDNSAIGSASTFPSQTMRKTPSLPEGSSDTSTENLPSSPLYSPTGTSVTSQDDAMSDIVIPNTKGGTLTRMRRRYFN
ncbi:hypothetical protein BGZ60DRAFT_514571 [Tricladium varicosporioides]|nr:hypothetical protein BGZ60DRAFT_514571 [Hymenoscyphus varicosporioides]